MKKGLLLVIFFLLFLSACSLKQDAQTVDSSEDVIDSETQTVIVGNDRDDHGCIGSAGYTWCEVKQKCLRPWEEECGSDDEVVCLKEDDCCLADADCIYNNASKACVILDDQMSQRLSTEHASVVDSQHLEKIECLCQFNECVTIDENLKLLKRGEKCNGDDECESGLVCVYPCGIPDCHNVCDLPGGLPRP